MKDPFFSLLMQANVSNQSDLVEWQVIMLGDIRQNSSIMGHHKEGFFTFFSSLQSQPKIRPFNQKVTFLLLTPTDKHQHAFMWDRPINASGNVNNFFVFFLARRRYVFKERNHLELLSNWQMQGDSLVQGRICCYISHKIQP